MHYVKVNLRSEYSDILSRDVYLHGVLYDDNFEYPKIPRRGVLVLPGGGYEFISYREKDPIIFKFNSLGYNSFYLDYSCKVSYPTPYLELMCAIHYMNKHSSELGIKQKEITLIGFSAGGHLASSYAGIYKDISHGLELDLIKPFCLVLAYPVTSLVNAKDGACSNNLANHDEKTLHLLSSVEHVSSDYPPTFMWTTRKDEFIDPRNVTWLKKELNKHGVKNKCIIYPNGPHALALANESTWCNKPKWLNKRVSGWPEKAHKFIKSIKEK